MISVNELPYEMTLTSSNRLQVLLLSRCFAAMCTIVVWYEILFEYTAPIEKKYQH